MGRYCFQPWTKIRGLVKVPDIIVLAFPLTQPTKKEKLLIMLNTLKEKMASTKKNLLEDQNVEDKQDTMPINLFKTKTRRENWTKMFWT